MKIAYIYPEKLPSKKARSISVINTACSLSNYINTTLIYEKSKSSNILKNYHRECNSLNLIPINKKFIIRSNKFFNMNLKKYFNNFDFFYVRHLKVANYLIKHNLPVLYELHEFFQESNPKVKSIENFVLENSIGIVTINNYLKKLFMKKYKNNNIEVIRNGCGFNFDYQAKNFNNIKELYYIGSFQKWKGVDFLVENMKYFRELNLNIVGDGDKTNIIKIITKNNLRNIIFLGFKTPKEIQEILTKSKITIIPNIPMKESFYSTPIKLYEYMLSSNIVLAPNFPSIKEIIIDGYNGFLFKAGDSQDFIKKLKLILSLNNKELAYISKNAYQSVKDFTWDNRAKKIIDFLKKIK